MKTEAPAETQELVNLYKTMLVIRFFEEQVKTEFMQNKIPGMLHLSIGQEAIAAGICAHLGQGDYMASHHRGHGHFIARGADLRKMMAELYGKATGYCKGKGGSMHIADLDLGSLGANGIVGGGLTIATGAALALQIRKAIGKVVVCFFGDGALSMGELHESLNIASLWKLPVVFVCENNYYAMSNPLKKTCPISELSKRAEGYGMPGVNLDGMDVMAVYQAGAEAIQKAREGAGPSFLVCNTYRFYGHGRNPDTSSYRTKEEEATWIERCPVAACEKRIRGLGLLDEAGLAKLKAGIMEDVTESVRFAEASPFPELAEIKEDIYA